MDVEISGVLRDSIWVVIKLGGPMLIVALIVGLIVSLIQAVTQINEATLAFLPKLLAICGVLLFLGPFMTSVMTDFMNNIMDRVILVGGQ